MTPERIGVPLQTRLRCPGMFTFTTGLARAAPRRETAAAVCRIKPLRRLHCCALPVLCWGGAEALGHGEPPPGTFPRSLARPEFRRAPGQRRVSARFILSISEMETRTVICLANLPRKCRSCANHSRFVAVPAICIERVKALCRYACARVLQSIFRSYRKSSGFRRRRTVCDQSCQTGSV